MYKQLTLGASLVLVFASLIGLVQIQPASATVVEPKVSICHRTNSTTNPYTKPEVNLSSVDGDLGNDNGQGDHFSEHTGPIATSMAVADALKADKENWGDIIPAIDGIHEGLNWTTEGQAIYYNNCSYGPADVTFTDPTCEVLGTYTIPDSAGYTYSINKVVTAAGEYTAPNGSTVTIIVHALEGYELSEGATSEWAHTFTAPAEADCVLGDTDTPPAKLPVTSGDSTIANIAIFASIVSLVTILSLVARSVLARQI